MDMSKPRAYVVHPVHGLKMIYLDEREKYLAEGWHRPGQKPVEPLKEPEKIIDPDIVEEVKEPVVETKKDLDEWYEAVKNDASDLSEWLNQTYGLNTNHRQGLAKLQVIANDYRAKNN